MLRENEVQDLTDISSLQKLEILEANLDLGQMCFTFQKLEQEPRILAIPSPRSKGPPQSPALLEEEREMAALSRESLFFLIPWSGHLCRFFHLTFMVLL